MSFSLIVLALTIFYSRKPINSKVRNSEKFGRTRQSVGPSYINADIFAATLKDVIDENTNNNNTDIKTLDKLNTLNFYTPAKSVIQKWLKEFEKASSEPLTEITMYEDKFEKAQKRSAGVYKRNSKGLSFLIGLLLAILLNADSLHIFSQLTQPNNPATNEIITEIAKLQNEDVKFFGEQCPEGNAECQENKIQLLVSIYEKIGVKKLPIGWGLNNQKDEAQNEQFKKDIEQIAKLTSIINKFDSGYFSSGEQGNEKCKKDAINIEECLIEVENKLIALTTSNDNAPLETDVLLGTALLFEDKSQFEKSIQDIFNEDGTINKERFQIYWTEYEPFIKDQGKYQFVNSIKNMRNKAGTINEDKVQEFRETYKPFLEEQGENKLRESLDNIKNEQGNIDPDKLNTLAETSWTEYNSLIEKQDKEQFVNSIQVMIKEDGTINEEKVQEFEKIYKPFLEEQDENKLRESLDNIKNEQGNIDPDKLNTLAETFWLEYKPLYTSWFIEKRYKEQLQEKIKEVFDENASINKNTLNQLWKEYKSFIDERYKNRFLDSIKTARNNDGSINDDQLNTFWTEYKSFINAKYKKRLDLILNLKNEPQLQLAQQINKTVENQGGWWKVPFGWVITAIAISMGAPFWFDILSRIVNVRNANKNKDEEET